jgi:hypothetical protein
VKKMYLLLVIHFGVSFCWINAQELACGVWYERIHDAQGPNVIYILRVNPKEASIVVEAAQQLLAGAEKTSEIARRKGAIAAINGGFFDFGTNSRTKDTWIKALDALGISNNYDTLPVFTLKIGSQWLSTSKITAGVLGWKDGGQIVATDALSMQWQIQLGDDFYKIADINKPYADGSILYSSVYTKITPVKKKVVDVVIDKDRVIAIKKGGGSSIPANGYVYSTKGSVSTLDRYLGMSARVLKQFKPTLSSRDDWEQMDYLLGSTPLLIKDGQILPRILTSTSSFYTKHYPRTAVGILPNGEWLLVVVDGRQSTSSGMTLIELARWLQKAGCVTAINLDGGGSSTCVIRDRVVNTTSGYEYALSKSERPVANAILVLPK